MDVGVKFNDASSNGFRDIRRAVFVSNEAYHIKMTEKPPPTGLDRISLERLSEDQEILHAYQLQSASQIWRI